MSRYHHPRLRPSNGELAVRARYYALSNHHSRTAEERADAFREWRAGQLLACIFSELNLEEWQRRFATHVLARGVMS